MRCGEHWPQTDRVWRQFAQLDHVLERLEIDPVLAARKSGGTAIANARNICLACLWQRDCAHWLEQGADPRAVFEFCPNAGFFRECHQASV